MELFQVEVFFTKNYILKEHSTSNIVGLKIVLLKKRIRIDATGQEKFSFLTPDRVNHMALAQTVSPPLPLNPFVTLQLAEFCFATLKENVLQPKTHKAQTSICAHKTALQHRAY